MKETHTEYMMIENDMASIEKFQSSSRAQKEFYGRHYENSKIEIKNWLMNDKLK